MAKGTSFAEKSKGDKSIDHTFIKYVKSVQSEKTGHWRFNEQIVALASGETLDAALKRMHASAMALDLELPAPLIKSSDAIQKDAELNKESEQTAQTGS